MDNKTICIASLNTRGIFKEADKSMQKAFISHLRSRSLYIDILYLQEVTAFSTQTYLSAKQQTNSTPLCSLTAVFCFQNTAQLYSSNIPWYLPICPFHLMSDASMPQFVTSIIALFVKLSMFMLQLNPLIVYISMNPS